MLAGFLIASVYYIFYTDMLVRKIISVLHKDSTKDTDNEDDGAGYWKPKGWKPDEP